MNIIQLKAFCSVARTLSFTASAGELMLSQPAVSRQIAALEEEIGARLFTRGHNTLALTLAGAQLYEELPGKLEELEAMFFSVRLIGIGKVRRLKLGVLRDQRPDPWMIRIMRSMRDENYYVTIQQYDFQNLERAVANHDIDAAISLQWVPTAFEGCRSMKLREEKLCLAVNRDYAPQIPKEISRGSLAEFSRIRPAMIPAASSFSHSQRGAVAERTAQFWPGVIEEAVDCIVPMVQAGIGSALVNECHVLSTEASVEMLPLEFLAPVPKAVFWTGSRPNDSTEDFIKRLGELTRGA